MSSIKCLNIDLLFKKEMKMDVQEDNV